MTSGRSRRSAINAGKKALHERWVSEHEVSALDPAWEAAAADAMTALDAAHDAGHILWAPEASAVEDVRQKLDAGWQLVPPNATVLYPAGPECPQCDLPKDHDGECVPMNWGD